MQLKADALLMDKRGDRAIAKQLGLSVGCIRLEGSELADVSSSAEQAVPAKLTADGKSVGERMQ